MNTITTAGAYISGSIFRSSPWCLATELVMIDEWCEVETATETFRWPVAESPGRRTSLKAQVFLWVCQNRGVDDEDVAKHFRLSGKLAGDLIDDLLREGLLDFDQ